MEAVGALILLLKFQEAPSYLKTSTQPESEELGAPMSNVDFPTNSKEDPNQPFGSGNLDFRHST